MLRELNRAGTVQINHVHLRIEVCLAEEPTNTDSSIDAGYIDRSVRRFDLCPKCIDAFARSEVSLYGRNFSTLRPKLRNSLLDPLSGGANN
jgi:hypothetical protein